MGILEIIAGVMLIISCIVLILMVLSQESKGQGLSSVITGQEGVSGETRARGKEARQQRITRVCAIIFFVLTLAVNIFSVLASAE